MTKEECIALLERYAEYDGMGIPNLAGCREAMKMAADLLSQPPLPSDLDEAAEETAKKYYCSCLEKHNETGICDGCENVKLSFKASAEWLAKQGHSQEEIVEDKTLELGYGTLSGIDPIINLSDSFKPGDKVIVQVRKK